MSLLGLVIVLIVVGILLWFVETQLPIDGTIKKIIHAVVILVVILYLLEAFGLIGQLGSLQVPRIR